MSGHTPPRPSDYTPYTPFISKISLICVYDAADNDSPTEELLCKSLCKNEGISARPLIFRRNRTFGPVYPAKSALDLICGEGFEIAKTAILSRVRLPFRRISVKRTNLRVIQS